MAEYIKREEAVKLIFEQFHMYFEVPCLPRDEAIQRQVCAVRDKINQLPAADVAPVRHGLWIEKDKYAFGVMYDCSICGNRILDNGHSWNYCPNCGAKMDGGDDGETD